MPTLPKNLAPIRNAFAFILRDRVGKLYGANDIANVLKITADVDNNTDVDIKISSNLVVRAFNFDGKTELCTTHSIKLYRSLMNSQRFII